MPRISHSWLILATGFVVLFFSGGSRFAFGLMLKPMTDELGWSRSSLSLSVTAFMIVSALALPFVGRLLDRHGPRWIIVSGSLIGAVGIGLMGRVSRTLAGLRVVRPRLCHRARGNVGRLHRGHDKQVVC